MIGGGNIMRKGLIITTLLLTLASCVRRPLEDPDFSTRIDVKVDITAVANVTCDIYNEKIPIPAIESEVMRVLFFDQYRDKLLGESFISDISTDPETGAMSIHGDISILPGTYRMMIYTFGTESTLISDYDSWESGRAYTDPLSEAALRALSLKSSDDQRICYQPDHLLVASSSEETIPYHAGVYTIKAKAASIVQTYYLQVKVDGLEYVSSAMATLSSMAPSATLSTGKMDTENPVTIYIPLQKSDDEGEPIICNTFNTFGRIPESTNELKVTFDIKTVDGRIITRDFDISDLFLSEACLEHHWLLLEEHIEVPPPESPGPGGGGFDPSVDDWENESHEIIL